MRKFLSFLIILALIIGGVYFFSPRPPKDLYAPGAYCAFCDPKVLEAQTFYEDDLVRALYSHKPIYPGHCLIIPKRHVPRFEMLTDAEASQMMEMIKKVNGAVPQVFNTSAYLLLEKNGVEVGQTVPHVHFHYVPRKAGDDSELGFIYHMFRAAYWESPLRSNAMKDIVTELHDAMLIPAQ